MTRATRITATGAYRAVIGVMVMGVLVGACVTPPAPAPAKVDLGVTLGTTNPTPYYGRSIDISVTLDAHTNRVAAGVSVTVPLPSDLKYVTSSGAYDPVTSTWTVGSFPARGHLTLVITAEGQEVDTGKRTVTATVHSTTPDPDLSNNSASITEQVIPAPVTLAIVPNPGNPPFVDIGQPGSVGWTASLTATDNPTAPVPQATYQWFCATASGTPCPAADGTDLTNQTSLTYVMSTLGIDTYTVTLLAEVTDPNYQSGPYQTSISFSTINSG